MKKLILTLALSCLLPNMVFASDNLYANVMATGTYGNGMLFTQLSALEREEKKQG